MSASGSSSSSSRSTVARCSATSAGSASIGWGRVGAERVGDWGGELGRPPVTDEKPQARSGAPVDPGRVAGVHDIEGGLGDGGRGDAAGAIAATLPQGDVHSPVVAAGHPVL